MPSDILPLFSQRSSSCLCPIKNKENQAGTQLQNIPIGMIIVYTQQILKSKILMTYFTNALTQSQNGKRNKFCFLGKKYLLTHMPDNIHWWFLLNIIRQQKTSKRHPLGVTAYLFCCGSEHGLLPTCKWKKHFLRYWITTWVEDNTRLSPLDISNSAVLLTFAWVWKIQNNLTNAHHTYCKEINSIQSKGFSTLYFLWYPNATWCQNKNYK